MFEKFEKIRKSNKSSNGEFIVFTCLPQVHHPKDGELGKVTPNSQQVQLEVQNYHPSHGVAISIEDSPLSEEERKRYYKNPQNVMGSRKIRELMQAHEITMTKQQSGKSKSLKMALLFGVALTLQIIAVLLIFI